MRPWLRLSGLNPYWPILAALTLPHFSPVLAQALRDTLDSPQGNVYSMVERAGTLYMAGSFAQVRGPCGTAVPFDSASSQPRWIPRANGYVDVVLSDGAGGWFMGGGFNSVSGVACQNLAHARANSTVDPLGSGADGEVKCLAFQAGVLYVAGKFSNLSGAARAGLGAVSTTTALDLASGAATGLPSLWNPTPGSIVGALALDASVVYAGGTFTSIGLPPPATGSRRAAAPPEFRAAGIRMERSSCSP